MNFIILEKRRTDVLLIFNDSRLFIVQVLNLLMLYFLALALTNLS